MLSKTCVIHILNEFTDFVLEDEVRDSFVVNIKKEHFSVVRYELRKFNYRIVHKSTLPGSDSFTLVFMVGD